MGKGVIAGIVISVVIGGLLAVAFAFPQVLDQFNINTQSNFEEETKEPSDKLSKPKESPKTVVPKSEPEEAPEKFIPTLMTLDEVDPFYKTETWYTYKINAKTSDGNTCRGEFGEGKPFMDMITTPYVDPSKELSPCPYDINDAIVMNRVCLREDAPIDLKLHVQPNCEDIWDADKWFFVKQNIVITFTNGKQNGEAFSLVEYKDRLMKTNAVTIYQKGIGGQFLNQYPEPQIKDSSEFRAKLANSGHPLKFVIMHEDLGKIEQVCGEGGCQIYIESTGRTGTTGPRVI